MSTADTVSADSSAGLPVVDAIEQRSCRGEMSREMLGWNSAR